VKRVREIEEILRGIPDAHIAGNCYHGLSVSKVVEHAERLAARILARAPGP
jgi:hypothetical protein